MHQEVASAMRSADVLALLFEDAFPPVTLGHVERNISLIDHAGTCDVLTELRARMSSSGYRLAADELH